MILTLRYGRCRTGPLGRALTPTCLPTCIRTPHSCISHSRMPLCGLSCTQIACLLPAAPAPGRQAACGQHRCPGAGHAGRGGVQGVAEEQHGTCQARPAGGAGGTGGRAVGAHGGHGDLGTHVNVSAGLSPTWCAGGAGRGSCADGPVLEGNCRVLRNPRLLGMLLTWDMPLAARHR